MSDPCHPASTRSGAPLIPLPDVASIAGVDPYDALRGARVPRVFRSHPRLRQLAIQARKRLPVEIGPLLGVRPFPMAKTGGAAVAALGRWGVLGRVDKSQASPIVANLLRDPCHVQTGGWGYEFDVQTRWAFYPAGSPNMIATVFVVHGLAEAASAFAEEDWLKAIARAGEWIASQVVTDVGDTGPFFRYVPSSTTLVHNANALGAGALAFAGRLCGRTEWVDQALSCAMTTVCAQSSKGGWAYGASPGLAWEDNFHTAYTLDGLLRVWITTEDQSVRHALDSGVHGWERRFFEQDGAPRYTPARSYPHDIHSAATAVDVGARLAMWGWETADLARQVRSWTRTNLIDARHGRTRYQKHRFYTDDRHFVRWGDAHEWLAEASYALLVYGEKPPSDLRARELAMGSDPTGSVRSGRGDG